MKKISFFAFLCATTIASCESEWRSPPATAAALNQNLDEFCAQEHSSNKAEHNTFGPADYAVLAVMLVVSCAIGTFYGFFATKQKTSSQFLLGGSSMGTLPMSLSLAASFITAIELLGNPAEMYKFGTQFWTICFAFLFVIPITSKFYLPVYMKLRLTSSFEYLEMRFDKYVRILAALIYVVQMTLYTSVTVYAPALALSHVTGIGLYYTITLVYVVCIFYSSQGGMKAVIMTDTFQAAVLMGSLFAVMFLGQNLIGDTKYVFDTAYDSDRIHIFGMDTSLTKRHTLWSQVIGGVVYWVPMFCANQASIQKYLAVETIGQVRKALWVSAISLIVIYTINFYTGMLVFTQYYRCDPLNRKIPIQKDEILPYYVMKVLGKYPGIPGFFVAGIFAASLGTVASALNSLAAVTTKDFLECALNVRIPGNKGGLVSKWITIAFGAVSFLLIFLVKQIDSVLKAALTFNGIVGGVTLGLFTLGMFFPWINSKGALLGSLTALALVSWIGIGSQIAETNGYVSEMDKPAFNASCSCFTQESLSQPVETFYPYRISYMWYSAIGFVITTIFGAFTSWLVGFKDPATVHADLISPPLQWFYSSLSNDVKEILNLHIDSKIEAIQIKAQINQQKEPEVEKPPYKEESNNNSK